MKLKTAALIVLICITLHLIVNLLLLLQPVRPGSIITSKLFRLFNILIFDVSIALFFWVLYYKQSRCVKGNITGSALETSSAKQNTMLKEGECSNIDNDVQLAHGKKNSLLAKSSFILSLASIPFAVICSVIPRAAFYNDTLMEIARLVLPINFILMPASFLLGIGGLIHISLMRKKYYGYWMSFVGIGLSIILIVTLFYNVLVTMGEHMW